MPPCYCTQDLVPPSSYFGNGTVSLGWTYYHVMPGLKSAVNLSLPPCPGKPWSSGALLAPRKYRGRRKGLSTMSQSRVSRIASLSLFALRTTSSTIWLARVLYHAPGGILRCGAHAKYWMSVTWRTGAMRGSIASCRVGKHPG